jgi:hypothetical protein
MQTYKRGGRGNICMPGTQLETSSVNFYSFWKPADIPPKGKKTTYLKLQPLGKVTAVASRLLKIPKMYTLVSTPSFVGQLPIIRFIWDVEDGVILMVRPECNLADDSVFCIETFSLLPDQRFMSLYVQLNEHFGVVLFDEVARSFITIRDFRAKK